MLVKIDGTFSSKRSLSIGVPQGSILGPLMFIIFINDFALDSELISILFTDDTTLFHSGKDSLDDLIRSFKVKFLKLLE